ncbi:hypothetical protein Tco_1556238 [Tanacetum coccineum]
MALVLMAKAFKLNYSTPTNNNQRISSNPRNRQIAQPGMNMGQDRQMQMVEGNGRNQFRQYAGTEILGITNQKSKWGMKCCSSTVWGNATWNNGNQIRVLQHDRDRVILLELYSQNQGEGMLLISDSVVYCSKKKQESIPS